MDNRELEKKIMSSYRNIAPDILDSVLADCDAQKGRIITMQEKKKKTSVIKYIGGLAAALAIVLGGMGFYQSNHAIASTVMLDVNPGIEITANKSEKVLDVKPYNEDAKTVIGDMDFSGSSLDVTVNALIGSMLRNGYINEEANSILVSVESKDAATGQAIQTRLMNEINGIIEGENLDGAVLGQTVKDDANLQKLADQYGITIGKAKLIDQITKQNSLYSFEKLVPLTINELNIISESGATKLENIDYIGTASTSAYIGEQKAKEVAYKYAKVNEKDVTRVICELDWEDGVMVYEIDFDAAGMEYELEINAKTADVVKFDSEKSDDFRYQEQKNNPSSQQTTTNGQYIDEDAAKQAAFKHAGVDASKVTKCVAEFEHKHGTKIYEIDFDANGFEYEYDINALTGDVLQYSKEKDDDYRPANTGSSGTQETGKTNTGTTETKTDDIGRDAARNLALNHAGVSDVREYECERDYERGKAVYEISFVSGGYEYDYEIDAADGSILKSERERD